MINLSVKSRRGFLFSLTQIATLTSVGCGTLMYPERQGQSRSGPLDWKVVGLNTIGLLLFFVPGVIAFGVDWYNGTLFLPAGYGKSGGGGSGLTKIHIPKKDRNIPGLERILAKHLGREVRLDGDGCTTMQIEDMAECESIMTELASNQYRATEEEFVVRCQSPE